MSKKPLYDKKMVVTGLAVFLIIVTFPFWYNMGSAAPAPQPKLTDKAKEAKVCVAPTEYMRANHMQLLNLWRTDVVRNGDRLYVTADSHSRTYTMSLSNTCLDCHSNKVEFCDPCHNYAAVTPYCWECHIENPKEKSS